MWHVLAGVDARSVAEGGCIEQPQLREGHRNNYGFSKMFCNRFLKLTGRTKLIPWPEIRAAAVEHALDRQALRVYGSGREQLMEHFLVGVCPTGSRAVLLIQV
eukprot:366154-Chlamydomonas_euryale.AAC.2